MKVLVVHTSLATFVQIDLHILRTAHEVQELQLRRSHPFHFGRDLVKVIHGAYWADVIVAWFGSYQAFWAFLPAMLLRRKRVIIASGYDVANLPEYNYSGLRPGLRRWMGLLAFRWAQHVLPVSHFSARQAMENAGVPPEKIRVIYHGLDEDKFHFAATLNQLRQGVLTVTTINDWTVRVKGIDLFIEAAKALPNVPFTVIGPWEGDAIQRLKVIAPANVSFTGPLYGDALVQAMTTACVYVQLSAFDSFGMAVAEAMLCGCAPVVTDRGALPEIVGDLGFIVSYGNVPATVQAIQTALTVDDETRRSYRQRIVENFSLAARQQQLLQALAEC